MARRAPHFGDFGISLDRASRIPLHRQIYEALCRSIFQGTIHADAHLPSTRALAGLLGVSRNTVLAAYDELTADGLAISRPGSGTCVGPVLGKTMPARVFAEKGSPRERRDAASPSGMRAEWAKLVIESSFPVRRLRFHDPDGNPLFLHDSRPQT